MSDTPRNPDDPAVDVSAASPPETAGATAARSDAPDEGAKSAEELERDIARTREELGETVDALSEKADVKKQVKGAVDEQKAQLRAKGDELKAKGDELKDKISGGGGGGGGESGGGEAGQRAKAVADEVAQRTSRQPLPYLAGALVLGIFLGRRMRKGRR